MRKRFNRACVASSSNYAVSRKAHMEHLREQHENNNIILMQVAARPVYKSSLKAFEDGLRKQLEEFKERHYGRLK